MCRNVRVAATGCDFTKGQCLAVTISLSSNPMACLEIAARRGPRAPNDGSRRLVRAAQTTERHPARHVWSKGCSTSRRIKCGGGGEAALLTGHEANHCGRLADFA
jgi:hypothetical protein